MLAAGGLVAALVAVGLLVRTRVALAESRERVRVLETDLDAALRPPPARTTAERAVRRVVRTAGRVREHGIAGMLQASVDDLQTWAAEQRSEVENMAASDGTVTLFFSDIENSTSLNEKVGDAAWVRVLGAHDQVVRTRVDKFRGQVVKTAGDGFMVAFRDPEAACRAALGIQQDLRRSLDPRLRTTPVRVRIGIHTGRVVSRDGDYFGRNVAMAARVGDKAVGGEVLASTAVRDALDDDAAVTMIETAQVNLKGLPGQHVLWRVTHRSEA